MEKVTISISKDLFEKLKGELGSEIKENNSYSDFIGKSIFFRTVTYHILGRVTKIVGDFFILETASWIADSGRFMNALQSGELSEVEPLGDWFVNITTVTDCGIWKHDLPTKQK
jgi:predicted CopG family antitoxin